MPITNDNPLAIYYEHPEWFRPLFAELDRRRIPHRRLHAERHVYDPGHAEQYALFFNRMSPSAWQRRRKTSIFYTLQYLEHLERRGVRVVNGVRAYRTEISKAAQLMLLEDLGLPYPRARVIHHPAEAPAAAEGMRFPIVIKPNIGGSGAGIRRFDTLDALAAAAAAGDLDLGIDFTGLVQEYIAQESSRITRVEVLGGRYLYAIRIYTPGDTFDLCPADVCQRVDGTALDGQMCAADAAQRGLRVEGYEPPAEIVAQVERILSVAGIEIGGVEYMIDARDGKLYYYDINALSNFVADAPRVIGFDPFVRLVDWLEQEADVAAARRKEAA
ncbi:MAG: hypothetical protein L0271_28015 [Gemmatimonadetes bacterium]|nr:hypothetical protein [Gemmatimonadota bacterium]